MFPVNWFIGKLRPEAKQRMPHSTKGAELFRRIRAGNIVPDHHRRGNRAAMSPMATRNPLGNAALPRNAVAIRRYLDSNCMSHDTIEMKTRKRAMMKKETQENGKLSIYCSRWCSTSLQRTVLN
jgi:hypothetical protein